MFGKGFFTVLTFGLAVISLIISVFGAYEAKSSAKTIFIQEVSKAAVVVTPTVAVTATPSGVVSVTPSVKKVLPVVTTVPVASPTAK